VLKLDNSVKTLYLQFSFSNENAVPRWLPLKEEETPAEAELRQKRMAKATGKCVIEPVAGCSIETLPDEITEAGFTLVDAYYQPRIDKINPRKRFFVARYVFIRTEEVARNELDELSWKILADLHDLCLLAFWRARAYKNPYFKDEQLVDGIFAASINVDTRKPRFNSAGELIMEWERDANKNKVGDASRPIPAAAKLRIQDNTLQIVPS
jgi:hypothetical protein